MARDEGLKILNFELLPKTNEELVARYTRYYEANDPAKGGSFYLQSKFVRAKEVVEEQMEEESQNSEKRGEER
jgi:import inner membrane translocase subunit TIM16